MMENGTIKVEGRGSIHVVPDVTRLIVTVDSTFSNYADAYARGQENAKWMRQIMTYNKQDANRVKSIKFDISDHYENEYDSNGHYVGQYKDGFELNQKFKVDMGIDPVLLNKLVRGVGKFVLDAQIDIRYTVLDERLIHLKLIERAVKDARAKAQVIVDTAGCALGNIKCIDYGDHGFDVISEARNIHSNAEATACVADSLDIMPDDMSVSDRVSVEFYIA